MSDINTLPEWARTQLRALQSSHGRLAAVASARGWQGADDRLSLADYLCEALPASGVVEMRGCYDCGFSGARFRTLVQGEGELASECPSCSSHRTDDASTVLRELVATVEDMREKLHATGAPAASLPLSLPVLEGLEYVRRDGSRARVAHLDYSMASVLAVAEGGSPVWAHTGRNDEDLETPHDFIGNAPAPPAALA